MALGSGSFTRLLRWWFYQHGRFCAKHPRIAAVIGIVVILLSALGLFNPRGQPFVFEFRGMIRDFFAFARHYAVPRWHIGAYLLLVFHVAWATDNGVKYSTLRRVQSAMGLKNLTQEPKNKSKKPPWSPPFAVRFILGVCGVLTILFSVVLACAVAHSLFGIGMTAIFDELPFLVWFMGVQGVYSLLDASTLTYGQSERMEGEKLYVVDRVKQIAMATSLTGPEELLTSLTKAAVALVIFLPAGTMLGQWGEPLANFSVHAGLAVLFKCLLQMSVFATIVQALVPFWDPRQAKHQVPTADIKCRVCFESSGDLRRCPCRCTGSVGYIHPVCFQQWFETKKSMRCELCHVIFQVRMLPTSVMTNIQTMESFAADLLPVLAKRLFVYLAVVFVLCCNKLGIMALDWTSEIVRKLLGLQSGGLPLFIFSCVLFASPAIFASLLGVVPQVLTEWHRRHRIMHWDGPVDLDGLDDLGSNSDDEAVEELSAAELRDKECLSADGAEAPGLEGIGPERLRSGQLDVGRLGAITTF